MAWQLCLENMAAFFNAHKIRLVTATVFPYTIDYTGKVGDMGLAG